MLGYATHYSSKLAFCLHRFMCLAADYHLFLHAICIHFMLIYFGYRLWLARYEYLYSKMIDVPILLSISV